MWDKVKNFDALQQWHPAVAASPATQGNSVGSVRTIALKGGGEIAWIGGKGPEEYSVGECAAALTELIAQSA